MASKIKFEMPDFSLALKNATEKAIEEAGFEMEGTAKQNAPVDSGYYRNNIKFDGKNQVIANADYSASIEFGVKAHTIEAKNAKVLHFKVDGKDVFAKSVKIPKRKPNPVMRNAALKVQKEIGGTFTRHFKKELKKNV